jgi:hypothetical protein
VKVIDGRTIHVLVGLGIMALALASRIGLPELWDSKLLTFGSVGGFLTFYGVIFSVVETMRSRSAAQEAKIAAQNAQNQTAKLFSIRDISECQYCIQIALSDLDDVGWVQTSSLSRILKLYTAEFHGDYEEIGSAHREAIGSLRSHAASASGPLGKLTLKRLKNTLLGMLAELTAKGSKKMSEAYK